MSDPALDALRRLRDSLQAFSKALASGNTTAVLAIELPLVDAVRHLPRSAAPADAKERAAIRALVDENRILLKRCQRLGAAARDLAELSGRFTRHAYGRSGTFVPAPVRPTLVSRS